MGHGLSHEGYVTVIGLGEGWFIRFTADGKANIAKYRASDAHGGELPDAEITIEADQWLEAIGAVSSAKKPKAKKSA